MDKHYIDINLDILKDERFQDDFAQMFSMTFIPKVEQFRIDFPKAILDQDIPELKNMVHTIVASLNFLELTDFVKLLYQYEEMNLTNIDNVKIYTNLVSEQCLVLIEELKKNL